MIRGIGTDLERIARFVPLLEKESFLKRAYTQQEREYIAARSSPAESAAGIFCAKEALSKALGTGLFRMLFLEAEVVHGPSGAPSFRFSGALLQRLSGTRVHLSIAHSGDYASAYVIWEETNDPA